MSFKKTIKSILNKLYDDKKIKYETLYRIDKINSSREEKEQNGLFLNDVVNDVLNFANLKGDYKMALNRIFYKMSVDEDYKNKIYSDLPIIKDEKFGDLKISFVDYFCSISFFFNKEQLKIFFKTVPEELLLNNKVTNNDIAGEMTPLLMLYSISPKNFLFFLDICSEYKEKLSSFNFFRGNEHSLTINKIFVEQFKKEKMRESLLPYINFDLLNEDNNTLMMLIKSNKNILKIFLDNNYIRGNNFLFLLTIFYIEKNITEKEYFEKIHLLKEYSLLSDETFVKNPGLISQMTPENLIKIQENGYVNNFEFNDFIVLLINSVNLGNLKMFEELLSQFGKIKRESHEMEKYNSHVDIILEKSFFTVKNFDNKKHSLSKHIDFFLGKMQIGLMDIKENEDNILIKVFKEAENYVLTEEDILTLKKYNFELFDKNGNDKEALDFANKENLKMLSKFYLEEISFKEKEKILKSLNQSNKIIRTKEVKRI